MKEIKIITLGQDAYWLQMIKKATDEIITTNELDCFNSIEDFLNSAQKPDPTTLLLIDVSAQLSIKTTIQRLRELGWRYIVAVAADPSIKDAYAVLHDAGGYDYWKKTYQVPVIRVNIEKCFDEMTIT